jgi:hypothetical protein
VVEDHAVSSGHDRRLGAFPDGFGRFRADASMMGV